MDRGPWIQTFTGRKFHPLDPRAEDLEIVDVAHALSHQCRYAGHCRYFYSVAQHSLLVSEHVPAEHALWGLLHDATEAYLVDLPKPLKQAMPIYGEIEKRLMAVICERWGLPPDEPDAVKLVDRRILADEAKKLLGPVPADWGHTDPPLGIDIVPMTSIEAKWRFLERFEDLLKLRTAGIVAPSVSDVAHIASAQASDEDIFA